MVWPRVYTVTIIFMFVALLGAYSILPATQEPFQESLRAEISPENQAIIDHNRTLVEQEALNYDFYRNEQNKFLENMPVARTAGDLTLVESAARRKLEVSAEEDIIASLNAFEREAVLTPGGLAFIEAGKARKEAREKKEADDLLADFEEAKKDTRETFCDIEADAREKIKDAYNALFEQEQFERARILREQRLKEQNTIVYGFPHNNPVVAIYEGDKTRVPLFVAQIVVEGILAHSVIKNRKASIVKKMLDQPETYITEFAPFVDQPEVVQTQAVPTEVVSPEKVEGAQKLGKQKQSVKKEKEKEGFFDKFTNLFSSKPKKQTLKGLVKTKGKVSLSQEATKPQKESESKLEQLKAKKPGVKPSDQAALNLSWSDRINDFIYGKKTAAWEKQLEQKNPVAFARYKKNKEVIEQKKHELNKVKRLISWLNKEHEFITWKAPMRGALVAPFALNCALRMALAKLEQAYVEDPRFRSDDRFGFSLNGVDGAMGLYANGLSCLAGDTQSYDSLNDGNIFSRTASRFFSPVLHAGSFAKDKVGDAKDSALSLIAQKDERLAVLADKILCRPPQAGVSLLGGMYNFLRGRVHMASIASVYKTYQEKGLYDTLLDSKEACIEFCTEMKMLYKSYEPEMNVDPRDKAEADELIKKHQEEFSQYCNRLHHEEGFLKEELRKYTQVLQEKTPALWAFEKKSDSTYQVAGYDLEKIPQAESAWERDAGGHLVKKEVIPAETRSFPCSFLPAEVTNQVRTWPFKLPPVSSLTILKMAKKLAWVKFAGAENIYKLLPLFAFGEFFSPSMRGMLTHRLCRIPPAVSRIMWSGPAQQLAQLGHTWLEVKEIDSIYHARWIKFITTHKAVFVRLLRQLLAARQLLQTEPILGAEAVQLAEKEVRCFVNAGHTGPYNNLFGAYVGLDKAMDRDAGIMKTNAKLSVYNGTIMASALAFGLRAFWLPGVTPGFLKPVFRKVGLL